MNDQKLQGWGWPGTAAKAHYFGEDGRSLCGKWLYMGRIDGDQEMGEKPLTTDCVVCWRKVKEATK